MKTKPWLTGFADDSPGMTFADLLAVLEEPLKSAGCWGYTPLAHSLGPHFLAGRTTVNQGRPSST